MRLAAPLLALALCQALPTAAHAALGFETNTSPSEKPAVEQSDFTESNAQIYEKQRALRLDQQKRAKMRSQARNVAIIVGPVLLIILVAVLYARAKTGDPKRSTRRKLKQAEVRRRSGGPEQVLDPRQW